MKHVCCFFAAFLCCSNTLFSQDAVLERKKNFDEAKATANADFQRAITAMFETIGESLSDALKDSTQKGDLEVALGVRETKELFEKQAERFKRDAVLEPAATPNPLPKIGAVRSAFTKRKELQSRAEKERERKLTPLYKEYVADLNRFVTETTKEGRLDDAKKIATQRDDVQKEFDEFVDPPENASQRTTKTKVAIPAGQEKILATPNVSRLSPEQGKALFAFLEKLPGPTRTTPLQGFDNWCAGGRCISADRTKLFCSAGDRDKKGRIYDLASKEVLGTITYAGNNICGAAFHPDKPILYTVDDSSSVSCWNTETFKKTGEFAVCPNGKISCLDISPDGSFGVSGTSEKTVVFWDTASGKIRSVAGGHADAVSAVAIHPSGKSFASGGKDKRIVVQRISDSKPLFVFDDVVKDRVITLRFSPGGTKLLCTGFTGDNPYAYIVDLKNGTPWRMFGGYGQTIRSANFSEDETLVATGDVNYRVTIWDVASRKPLFCIPRNKGDFIYDVFFGAQDESLAVVSGFVPEIHELPRKK